MPIGIGCVSAVRVSGLVHDVREADAGALDWGGMIETTSLRGWVHDVRAGRGNGGDE